MSISKVMDFVVPSEKVDILHRSSHHINTLFDVQVSIQQEGINGKRWVKIQCSPQDGGEGLQKVEKAKEYIEALCCPEITIETIPNASRVIPNLDTVSRNYGVVANADNTRVILRGSQINVALAKSWIEEKHEAQPPSSNTNATADANSSIYTCKKFATKLGYSEADIDVVAKTLGPGPIDINTFLQELIFRTRSRTTGAATQNRTVSDKRRSDVVPRGISARSMPHDGDRIIIEAPKRRFENAQPDGQCYQREDLCPIIIDGSNVAMHHGNHRVFSCRGILLCVEWFQKRGHTEVYVLVPRYRAEPPREGYPIEDQHLLIELSKMGVVKFTPSRRNDDGRDIVCYDDRFIVDLAYKLEGVIVSNDGYRDLKQENVVWKHIIEKRVLMFSFVRDLFMVPDDPLGRKGPNLTEFLKRKGNTTHRRICPWIGNCTYGSKCKYYHPDGEQGTGENLGQVYQRQQQQQQQQKQQQQQQQQQQQYLQQNQHYLSQQEYWHDPRMLQNHLIDTYHVQQQLPQHGHHQHDHQHMSTSSWVSTPAQYSYTPPNSFGYNNSSSNQQTLFTKLIDIFPDQGEHIKCLLEENTERNNIEELIEKLLLNQ